ncbi:hypothetical protein TNCV_630581 [Trichonephila clavipes]|nr:hypothetical protein TNCV_630581 [Trichonephila clavipes]
MVVASEWVVVSDVTEKFSPPPSVQSQVSLSESYGQMCPNRESSEKLATQRNSQNSSDENGQNTNSIMESRYIVEICRLVFENRIDYRL